MKTFLTSALVLLATACGSSGAVDVGPASSAPAGSTSSGGGSVTAPPTSGPTTSPASPSGPLLDAWFVRAGSVVPVERHAVGIAVIHDAVAALLAGPSPAESRRGVSSDIPAGTQLLGVSLHHGTATVDVTSDFLSGGAVTAERARLAQLVYTVTQFRGVTGVTLHADGAPASAFPGGGLVIPRVLTQQSMNFADLVPPIVVTSPVPGQTVTAPITVRGVADVFEAALRYRLLDAAGHPLVEGRTSASCGTGCAGAFSFEIPELGVSHAQPGTLVVTDSDPSGIPSKTIVVRVPVRLQPLIDVSQPLPGATITSPVAVTFTARAAGAVLIRVMDARFHELGRKVVQLGVYGPCCGTHVAFSATGVEPGYVVVSPVHHSSTSAVVEIPVTLNGG